ncbi:MAG: ABC transporter ATP-binding protein [Defluviitaleaceae bacterium]|nr:ABC transporter ATP-binding protein [Defluviitaleaceae bacterium]
MDEVVSIKNLGKTYSRKVIFRDVNIDIKRGSPVVLMGSNGCGKSTLLKIVVGALLPTKGEVKHNADIKTAFVPDRFPKLPFTVESYLMHMGEIQGVARSQVDAYMDEYFEYLNMPYDFRKTKISKCSKGTIQKVNILQALITKPDLLVMDEPFSGLDEASEHGLLKLILNLSVEGVALVIACHEKELAQKITRNVYVFENKTLVAQQNDFVEQYRVEFINSENGKHGDVIASKEELQKTLKGLLERGLEVYGVNQI